MSSAIGSITVLLVSLSCLEVNAQTAPETLVITEFMAANASGKQDQDGEFSDWIEIFNPTFAPVSLQGWRLTDDARDLGKWTFPNVTIPRQGHLLVFASGKNRTNAAAELHANFSLDRDGEFLGLVRPDGSIATRFAPAFPRQVTDVSYGSVMIAEQDRFVPAEAQGRFLAPGDSGDSLIWMSPPYDDGAWTPAQMGIGYDRIPPGERDPAEPVSSLADVTTPGDVTVPTSSNSPGNEGVSNAIDNTTSTKYLNFDKLNTGFTVTPARGASIVTGLRITSANDAPERDPASFVLSGSNDGNAFAEIARGSIPIFSGRFVPVEVAFSNRVAFSHYRLLFPTVRNAAASCCMQLAEAEFLGVLGASVPAFSELIKTKIESALFGTKSSVYLRLPFELSEIKPLETLRLRMRYDDGFVAWLNGVRVAGANAPAVLAYNAVASTNRFRADAAREWAFDLNAFTNLLRIGTNVLAIQGFNDHANSPDFLLDARLDNTRLLLGQASYFEAPTPGGDNSAPSAGVVSDLVFNQTRGFFDVPFDLTIACPTAGSIIRYTTDGSAPGAAHGLAYSGPIRVDRTTVLRAVGLREGWISSRVETFTYLFVADVATQSRASALAAGFPANWNSQAADYGLDARVIGASAFGGKYARTFQTDLKSIPTLSIVMNVGDMFGSQGIYANPEARGEAWERATSLELIFPDQRNGFQEDAGIRIQGGAFRRFDLTLKKSFRVVFRERYGNGKLRYPLFGPGAADEFDNFVLRANSNDAWPYGGGNSLYVRDSFAMQSVREMGQVASHSSFVHLYINGQYWGLYNPTERPDAAFSATYHGGDQETWDAINQDSAPDGTYDAWNRLMSALNQDFSKNDVYQRIQGNNPDGTRNPAYEHLLDVGSMIDYMILNFYVGNLDWPGRNWWTGRDRNNGDGFKFYPWDTETALGFSSVTHDGTGVTGAVAQPYARVRANANFRLQFADRVYRHFFHGGAFYVNPASPAWNPVRPENNRPAARFSALAEGIRGPIVGETARWGDQLNATPYTRDEHWQPTLNSLLVNYFPRRSSNVLESFRRASLYPRTDPPVMNVRGGLVDPGFNLTLSSPVGTIFYTLNGLDPRASNAVFRYTGPIPMQDLTTVKTRVLNGQEWSALNEATFVVGQPSLALSELHYHPADPNAAERAAGFLNADDFEFVEFWNNGAATFDLATFSFAAGIEFEFPGSAITRVAPGEFVLVVKNRAAFEKRYGPGLPIAGEYSGRLDNSGERLQLGNVNFTYGTRFPWPEGADGSGPSLELIDTKTNLSAAASWRASNASGGSPGKANPPAPVTLEVNSGAVAFAGIAGSGYTVYASDSLSTGTWNVVERAEPLSATRRVEIKFNVTSPATRFFRVSIP